MARKNDLLVVLASHNELTTRGEEVLRRMLDSLARALAYLARQRPGVDVYVACCDDASTDATAEYIERSFHGKDWFKLVRNKTTCLAGFSRNVAAAQFDTELICLLDADDEYKENHLVVCADVMEKVLGPAGKKPLAASTTAELSVAVHPGWVPRISEVLPITKVIRRVAWEFVEGLPMEAMYHHTSGDDQFLVLKLNHFCELVLMPAVTVKYWSYPGSAFDKQLAKFRQDPALFDPQRDDPPHLRELHIQRLQSERAFIDYLEQKLDRMAWREKLQGYALRDPLPRYGESGQPRTEATGGATPPPRAVAGAPANHHARPAPVRSVMVPIAPGELVDKLTILRIKSERLSDPAKLRSVHLELAALQAAHDQALTACPQLQALTEELKAINETLWQIEDDIRLCERNSEFGPRFIELARAVYHNNDSRSAVKRRINELFGSDIREEKQYTSY
jgi:hypothetical protein